MKTAKNNTIDFSDALEILRNPHPLFRKLAEASTLNSFEVTAQKASPEELKDLKQWLDIQSQLAVRLKEHFEFVTAEVVEALAQKGIQMSGPKAGEEKVPEVAEGLSPLEQVVTEVAGELPKTEGGKKAEAGVNEALSPLEQVIAEATHPSSQPAARTAVLTK